MTHEEIIVILKAARGEKRQTGKQEWLRTHPRRTTVAFRMTDFALPDGRGALYCGIVEGGEQLLMVGLKCLPEIDDPNEIYLPVWQIFYPNSVLPDVPLEVIASIPHELISTLWPDDEV